MGLSTCKEIGDWDTVIPDDGVWRQFYIPHSVLNPRVRVIRTVNGARVEWQSMKCVQQPFGPRVCTEYHPPS